MTQVWPCLKFHLFRKFRKGDAHAIAVQNHFISPIWLKLTRIIEHTICNIVFSKIYTTNPTLNHWDLGSGHVNDPKVNSLLWASNLVPDEPTGRLRQENYNTIFAILLPEPRKLSTVSLIYINNT